MHIILYPNIPCFNFSFLSQSCYDCSCSQSICVMHMFSKLGISRFPLFTSEDGLAKFTTLNFKQSIPDPFRAYCQSALNLQIPSQESVKVTDEGIRVAAVCGPLAALSAEKLKEADPAYPGAQLNFREVLAESNCAELQFCIVWEQYNR